MEHGEGAGAGQPGDEETPRHVTSARLEHLKRVQLHKAVKMPDTLTAASVLNGRKRVFITEYYREFNEYCRAHGLYELDRKGMRYLAYCNGYKKREGSGCTELIKN